MSDKTVIDLFEAAANNAKGPEYVSVNFKKSHAVVLCEKYLETHGSFRSLSQIVEDTVDQLFDVAVAFGVVSDEGVIDYSKKYSMYKMDLYQPDGSVDEEVFADLEPLTRDRDCRLAGGKRTSVSLRDTSRNKLNVLCQIYRLRSEAETVVHMIIVAATLKRIEVDHGSIVVTEVRKFDSPKTGISGWLKKLEGKTARLAA
ncbi:MAG: hypothetical protein MJA83_06235, partial [Gammaproteobacteria bacterium]|nr:hypothetical protein [Gammaproteobacteria bacterium]